MPLASASRVAGLRSVRAGRAAIGNKYRGGTVRESRGTRHEVRGTRYEVRGTRYEVRGTRDEVRGWERVYSWPRRRPPMTSAHVPEHIELPPPRIEEVSDGVFAYVQLDGSWGLNNTGFIVGGDGVTAIDTCFT